MSQDDFLQDLDQESIAYAYGVDSINKANMVKAFLANPDQKPFSSLLSVRVSKGAFANVYRHAFYPTSVIRLSTKDTGSLAASPTLRTGQEGHSHYIENWVIPYQGNRYTPKVDMYVRLKSGETLAIMEHLLPPPSSGQAVDGQALKAIYSMNRNKEKPASFRNLHRDLQGLILFLLKTPHSFQLDLNRNSKNILMRRCGQLVITDPLC